MFSPKLSIFGSGRENHTVVCTHMCTHTLRNNIPWNHLSGSAGLSPRGRSPRNSSGSYAALSTLDETVAGGHNRGASGNFHFHGTRYLPAHYFIPLLCFLLAACLFPLERKMHKGPEHGFVLEWQFQHPGHSQIQSRGISNQVLSE